ncbi:MAG: 30S ribosomal protein S17 [Candidatus Woesearchaeota archaeon]|nr:30S ribosomal protein S17 [Candidatus Woesearchaeota archaeon]
MQSIRTRGRTFTGIVLEARMQSTATVEWPRRKYVQKYERYERKRTRIKAHNPKEIDAKKGDIVKVEECRPISKTKHFTIIEKIGHEKLFEANQEMMEAAKVKQEKEDESA